MTERTITTEIDGLPVDVDAMEWLKDPEAVVKQVQEARANLQLPEDAEMAPDYDALIAKHGVENG